MLALVTLSLAIMTAVPVLGEDETMPDGPEEAVDETQVPEPGSILLSDNFDDPANGWLASSSPRPEYTLEYAGGEYVIKLVDLTYRAVASSSVPGSYRDASLAVDARLIGDTPQRFITLTCRASAAGNYIAYVYPEARLVRLRRFIGSDQVLLAEQAAESLRRDDATNRLELGCVGNTISVTINGFVAVNVEDGTHQEGNIRIGLGHASSADLPAEARFDNLVLTQH
jgi:hypothetical protein